MTLLSESRITLLENGSHDSFVGITDYSDLRIARIMSWRVDGPVNVGDSLPEPTVLKSTL